MPKNKQFEPLIIRAEMSADEEGIGDIYIKGPIVAYAWPEYYNETDAFSVRKALAGVDDAKVLNIHIDSPGGYLDEAMTIMSEISEHGATQKNAYIMECASAATLLTLPCNNVYIYEGGEVMIHNPRGGAYGTPKQIINYGEGLQKRADSVASLYAKRMGKPVEDIQSMMDAETWMTPQEAVDNGFAHEIIPVVAGSGVMMCAGDDGHRAMMGKLFGYRNCPKRDNACHMAKTQTSALFTGNNAPTSGAQSNNDEGKDDDQMPTSIDELRKQSPDLYNQVMALGAEQERARLRELDEIAKSIDGDEGAQMIHDAKYGETPRTAQDVAVEILKSGSMRKATAQPKANPGQSYLQKRKAETAQMQDVKGGASADNDPGADDDADIDAFAEMSNQHIARM